MTANGMGRRNNKVYGWLKRRYSEYMRGPNNPSKITGPWNKGRTGYSIKVNFSKEFLDATSAIMKDKNPCTGIKPWNHPRATEYSKSVWKEADKIYQIWINHDKPSYCKLYTLVNGKCYINDSKVIGPYMNIVKYFRNGWIPTEDTEWKRT
jgi:hypothetical protein